MKANTVTMTKKMINIIKFSIILFYVTAISGSIVIELICCFKAGQEINKFTYYGPTMNDSPSENKIDEKLQFFRKYNIYFKIGEIH